MMNLSTSNAYFGLLSTQRGNNRFLLMTNFLSNEAQSSLAGVIADAFGEEGHEINNLDDLRVVFGMPSVRVALTEHPLMSLFGANYTDTLINAAIDTIASIYGVEQ